MSFEPRICQKKPFVLPAETGKKAAWCACGLSARQPFCDGSHAREKTGMSPVVVTVEQTGTVAWCGCKRSGNKPFCDGTHNALP